MNGEKIKLSKLILDRNNLPIENKISFYIEGRVMSEIMVGKPVVIFKINKNGIPDYGYFYSSIVIEVTENGFVTQNSVYKVEKLG
jgi:hypothetical protein